MTSYSHRDRADLARLADTLSALGRLERAIIWVAMVRTGYWRPLWPIRAGLWLSCALRGPDAGVAGAIAGLTRLPAGVFEPEWAKFMAFVLDGRNADDPTSAGGLNHRGLRQLLDFAALAGGRDPETGEPGRSADPERKP